MKVMLKYELKRIFTKRLNRVLITIGLALSVILSFLAATSNRFVSPQGHLETGISATRKVVADKNRNKGLMTPKRISELIREHFVNTKIKVKATKFMEPAYSNIWTWNSLSAIF